MSRMVLLVGLVACGGSPQVATAPRPPEDPFLVEHERWEDVGEQRLVFSERCGTGPFEVEIPVRADDDPRFEYGRRMVLIVYGPRRLSFDDRLETTAGMQTGIHIGGVETEADHVECRAGDGVPVATTTAAVPAAPTKPGKAVTTTSKTPEKNWYLALNTPSENLPKLVPFTGAELGVKQQAGAIALYPKGNPFYYADDYWSQIYVGKAGPGIKLRFWFHRPSNLEGVVFRVVEQRLAPFSEPRYAESFAARVAAVKQRQDAERPANQKKFEQQVTHCRQFPDDEKQCGGVRMRIPPAPLDEKRPAAPNGEVAWVPGYWSWDDGLGDFAWIAGTYVIRPKKPVTEVAPAVATVPIAPTTPIEPARELDAQIEEPPAPKLEEVTPPPAPVVEKPNGVWIAGHWELAGTTWRWVAGAWTNAPAGTRYRPPVVRMRSKVRVYVPGGWVRIR